jgi:hypothetical protein
MRGELEAMLAHLRDAIGGVLGSPALARAREPMILAGRRRHLPLAHLAPPPGRGGWVVYGCSRLEVARQWLEAGRAADAADLLAARCDAGEVPLVFVFSDGTVSLSRAALRAGGVA